MRVWLYHRPVMRMLVMAIMRVTVLMFQPVMLVFVLMPLGEMKPQAKPHQTGCDRESGGQRFAQKGGNKAQELSMLLDLVF